MTFSDVLDEEETQDRAGPERRELPLWTFRERPSAFYVSGRKKAPQTYSHVSARRKARFGLCEVPEGLLGSVVAAKSLTLEEPIAERVGSVTHLLGQEWKLSWGTAHAFFCLGEIATAAATEEEEPSLSCFDAYVGSLREAAKLFLARETQAPEATLDWEKATERVRAERRAYEEQKEEILSGYEGQYVAILNGSVIDHDSEYGRLAARVYARLGRTAVLLTRATRERETARIGTGLACT